MLIERAGNVSQSGAHLLLQEVMQLPAIRDSEIDGCFDCFKR
jgi:hypothetical protein